MDGKIQQHISIKFCMRLGESATEPLKMLREAFGQHSLTGQRFLIVIHISSPVECQLKMNIQGDKAPAEAQKMLKKI
jgi:hypothetical protein